MTDLQPTFAAVVAQADRRMGDVKGMAVGKAQLCGRTRAYLNLISAEPSPQSRKDIILDMRKTKYG